MIRSDSYRQRTVDVEAMVASAKARAAAREKVVGSGANSTAVRAQYDACRINRSFQTMHG